MEISYENVVSINGAYLDQEIWENKKDATFKNSYDVDMVLIQQKKTVWLISYLAIRTIGKTNPNLI